MARIQFLNPNEPEQPASGVYRWFCRNGSTEFTLYVGKSGGRTEALGAASTLKRGILEAQRSCVSSNKGSSLDTDFIVGTALIFFRSKGFDCCWEHISNVPDEEQFHCNNYLPLLQIANGKIKPEFKLKNYGNTLWNIKDPGFAESALLERFVNHFKEY